MLFNTILLSLFSLFIHAKDDSSTKILIIGDSLTAGYGVPKESAYPYQLELLMHKKHPKVKVVAAGSSGSTSASGLTRLKWHLKAKPSHLILALGANDGLRGVKLSTTKENLGKTIDLAKEKGIKVYLAGMMLPLNYGKEYRQQFENLFKDLVKEKSIGFIPFLLKNVGGKPELNLPDGIHPNEKGHKIVAKNVYEVIEKDL